MAGGPRDSVITSSASLSGEVQASLERALKGWTLHKMEILASGIGLDCAIAKGYPGDQGGTGHHPLVYEWGTFREERGVVSAGIKGGHSCSCLFQHHQHMNPASPGWPLSPRSPLARFLPHCSDKPAETDCSTGPFKASKDESQKATRCSGHLTKKKEIWTLTQIWHVLFGGTMNKSDSPPESHFLDSQMKELNYVLLKISSFYASNVVG